MVRLTQLVDKELIISLQKRLTDELEMSIVFEEAIDGEMETIGERGKICMSCTEFIDVEGKGKKKCIRSDTDAAWSARGRASRALSEEEIIVQFYTCNGLMRNFVIPISIGGDVIGCVYAGQFLIDKSKDKNLEEMLKRMASFGYIKPAALNYATPPTEKDIPQIAKDNGISNEEYENFQKAYKKNLAPEKYKSLQEVINAVYLLSEIAKTISVLGSAYYIKNLYVRINYILPKLVEIEYTKDVDRLRTLSHEIEAKQIKDFSLRIKEINEIVYKLLRAVEKYEIEYIKNLFIINNEEIMKNENIGRLELDLKIAECKYELRNMEILLRVVRELFITDPHIIKECASKLYEFEKDLNDIMNEEDEIKLKQKEALSNLTRTVIESIKKLGEKIKKIGKGVSTPSIDEIEGIFDYLTEKKYGLLSIKKGLIEERVLSDLPINARKIREKLRLRYDTVYLNMGGISPTHHDVLIAQDEWSIIQNEFGPVSLITEELLESKKNILMNTRMAISKLLQAYPDEIIFTANTTHGIELSLDSIRFSPKNSQESPDEIILSTLEHDTAKYCCERICNKFNVNPIFINLQNNLSIDTIIQRIGQKITDYTKVILLSHITYNTGQIFDVKNIIKGVKEYIQTHDKKCCPLFLIDGAQAVGHIDVNVHDIGCDFYVADGHKWLLGPIGSGFLYVKREYLEHKGDFSFYKNYMVVEKHRPKKHSNIVYEPATMSIKTVVGLKAAIDCIYESNENGVKTFYKRIKQLTETFKELIRSELGIYDIILNDDNLSGIISLRFKEMDDSKYDEVRRLLEKKYHVVCRAIKDPPSLRFCIHFTNSKTEVNIAVKALKSILLNKYTQFVEKQRIEKEKREKERELMENVKKKRREVESNIENVYEKHIKILEKEYLTTLTLFRKIFERRDATEKYENKKKKLEATKVSLITRTENTSKIEELEKIDQEISEAFNKTV